LQVTGVVGLPAAVALPSGAGFVAAAKLQSNAVIAKY
jgi:hypothetical protein